MPRKITRQADRTPQERRRIALLNKKTRRRYRANLKTRPPRPRRPGDFIASKRFRTKALYEAWVAAGRPADWEDNFRPMPPCYGPPAARRWIRHTPEWFGKRGLSASFFLNCLRLSQEPSGSVRPNTVPKERKDYPLEVPKEPEGVREYKLPSKPGTRKRGVWGGQGARWQPVNPVLQGTVQEATEANWKTNGIATLAGGVNAALNGFMATIPGFAEKLTEWQEGNGDARDGKAR